jgi:DNA-binding NarL/FixJ family response regulator
LPRSRAKADTQEAGSLARRGPTTPRPVTDRQLEILSHAARGQTNRQIGEALGLSERTVRNHMRAILKRTSSSDRTQAVVRAIGNGWIAIPIEPEGQAADESNPIGSQRTASRERAGGKVR